MYVREPQRTPNKEELMAFSRTCISTFTFSYFIYFPYCTHSTARMPKLFEYSKFVLMLTPFCHLLSLFGVIFGDIPWKLLVIYFVDLELDLGYDY